MPEPSYSILLPIACCLTPVPAIIATLKTQEIMSEKKGWGTTVLGWFVVNESGGAESASADPLAPPADVSGEADRGQPAPVFFQKEPPAATGGKVDFDGVFDAAGIDAEERERVSKAMELLRSLPAGTDAMVKKQIVEASLKAFNVPIEKIIETGVEQIQALEGYIRTGATDTKTLTEESDNRIREYEDEIRQIRMVMQERVTEQQSVIKSCNEKKLEVQQILEFFGRDRVAQVVKESPKLHEPAKT